jgi:hypothetical protein
MTARRITVRGAARAAARTGIDCDGDIANFFSR